jgi:hypothetical protein
MAICFTHKGQSRSFCRIGERDFYHGLLGGAKVILITAPEEEVERRRFLCVLFLK